MDSSGYYEDFFDYAKAVVLKEQGMKVAADNRVGILQQARAIALELGRRHPRNECTADAVSMELQRRSLPSNLGPAAGSIFKDGNWYFTGQRIRSKRITNHAREIKVWRLKTENST